MASLNGFAGSISGTTGTANTIEPKSGWRVYTLPRGFHASAASTGTAISTDSASAASRVSTNQWVQVGTDTSKIVQVSSVSSSTVNVTPAVVVAENDRILVIGNTQPVVTGGSASYQPHTTLYSRDDDGSTVITNSVITTSSDGFYQLWKADGLNDLLVQDANRANVGIIPDVQIGIQPTADFLPLESAAVSLGSCAKPFNHLYLAGKWVSGVTSASGRTYFDYRTCEGVTQGNLFAFGISNQAPKVYGDTHGGVFQSWSLPEVFNVKSAKYGAKGDNSTDDTTAISAAITDAAAAVGAGTGGVVFLPRGTYVVNSTLTLPSTVRLVGSGRSATIIKAGGSFTFNGSTDAVVRIGAAGVNAHGTRIENLTIDCNSISGSIGVYSTTANELSGLEHVAVSRAILYGIFMSTTACANFDIENVEVYMSDSALVGTAKGIYLLNTAGAMNIDSVTINNYSGTGTNIAVGIHLDHTGGHQPRVTCSHFEGCAIGIRISSNDATVQDVTGNASTTALVAIDSGSDAYNLSGIHTSGSATGVSDSNLSVSTTADVTLHSVHTGVNYTVSSIAGVTARFGSGFAVGNTASFTGTVIGSAVTTLTAGTAITLPAGNLFGVSTSPAGTTTVTSFVTVHNGRRITLLGQAGTLTINAGNNIWTPGGTNKTLNVKDVAEFQCIGTTWVLLANPTAVS